MAKNSIIDYTNKSSFVINDELKIESYKEVMVVEKNETSAKIIVIDENDQKHTCIYIVKNIYELLLLDEPIDLMYTYIDGFDITKIENYEKKVINKFNAVNSIWSGDINFSKTKFFNEVWFMGASFNNCNMIFDDVIFENSELSFHHSTINNCTMSFHNNKLSNSKIVFDNAALLKTDISFNNAIMGKSSIDFFEANIKDSSLNLKEMTISDGNIDLTDIQSHNTRISFDDIIIDNCELGYSGIKFIDSSLNFYRVIFSGKHIIFSDIIGENSSIDFELSELNNCKLQFLDNKIARFKLSRIELNNSFIVRFSYIDKLVVQQCIIRDIFEVYYTKVNTLCLNETYNLGKIFFDYELTTTFGKKHNIEIALKKYIIESENKDNYRFDDQEMIEQLVMLKENYHNIGNYDDEDKAYRAYMKYKTNKPSKWLFKVFGLIGGYGTKPFRIISFMLVILILFALGYYFLMAPQFLHTNDTSLIKSIWDAIYYSGITFLTIGYGDISPALEASTLLRLVSVIEGFIGLFLMSYLTVAVVRKILR